MKTKEQIYLTCWWIHNESLIKSKSQDLKPNEKDKYLETILYLGLVILLLIYSNLLINNIWSSVNLWKIFKININHNLGLTCFFNPKIINSIDNYYEFKKYDCFDFCSWTWEDWDWYTDYLRRHFHNFIPKIYWIWEMSFQSSITYANLYFSDFLSI